MNIFFHSVMLDRDLEFLMTLCTRGVLMLLVDYRYVMGLYLLSVLLGQCLKPFASLGGLHALYPQGPSSKAVNSHMLL